MTKCGWLPVVLLVAGCSVDPPGETRREQQSIELDGVVAEIVEFAYEDDARLFFGPRVIPEARRQISAGQLWTTRSTWNWRVWSINRAGDVAFSGAWTFPN